MVLVCPVQAQEPLINARATHGLQAVDEFIIKLHHLREQFNATCTHLSNRLKQIEDLPKPQIASKYFFEVLKISELASVFNQIKCDLKYELEKIHTFIPGEIITITQSIVGDSSKKHAECL